MGRIPTVAFSTREHAVLILNAADVRQALPMTLAVEAMKQAFAAFSDGKAAVPPRIHLPIAPHAGVSLIMPSFVDAASTAEQALAVKVVSLFDGNQARGLARLQAAVVVLEPDTGRPIALLDGAMLTAIRTAAASGAATDLLARARLPHAGFVRSRCSSAGASGSDVLGAAHRHDLRLQPHAKPSRRVRRVRGSCARSIRDTNHRC